MTKKLANVTRGDVEAVVARIGGAGVYLSADLYEEYLAYAGEKGDPPGSFIAWGQALGRAGGQRKVRTVEGVKHRAWLV
jgi:hypothetical protein